MEVYAVRCIVRLEAEKATNGEHVPVLRSEWFWQKISGSILVEYQSGIMW